MNASAQNSKQLKAGNANQNIQVYVRLRPMNSRERGIRSQEVVEVPNSKEVITRVLLDAKTQKKFSFDKAFGPDSKQNEVYATVVAPLIDEVLSGYNCTVFAYGQTGTGKTHTMVGEETPELSLSWEDDSVIGIIPRALSHLFDELRMTECEFSMRVSYLELYNEELCDLLSTDDCVKIRIFDDSTKKGSVIVQGLEEIPVHSKDDVYKLLAKGQDRRKTASTLMNAQSSRSHTVFSILVHIKETDVNGEEMLKIGKLNLVDLAGSENISKAGNERGIRVRETVNINQSLLTLGRVITALVERTPHIPYRESKLTRLLQESLGGRTKTSIIATISPGHKDLEETLSTLDYAHRAKNIQNRPEINQRLTKKAVLKEYTEEIDKLKRDLMAARDKNGIFLAQESYNDMMYKIETSNKELTDKHLMIKALKDELSNKTKLFNEVSYNLIERTNELAETEGKLKSTETDLHYTIKTLCKTKRRYNEKKVILTQHMKTEETLTKQARDLIEQCELASADTDGLHETIERRKKVEEAITGSCDKFTTQLQENLSLMSTNLSDFSDKYCKQSKIIQNDIDSAAKAHGSLTTTLGDQLKSINKTITDSCSDRGTLLAFNLKQIDDKTTFNKKEILALVDQIKVTHDNHLAEISSVTKTCLSNFENQQKAFETKQNAFYKALKEKDSLVAHFTTTVKASIDAFMQESKRRFDVEYQKTNETVAQQEKEIEALQSTLGQFYTSMSTMLENAKSNTAEIKQGASRMAENRQGVDVKLQNWSLEMSKHAEKYQIFTEKEGKMHEETKKQAIDVQNINKLAVTKVQECTNNVVNEAKCSLTTLDKKISATVDEVAGLWHAQTEEITELDEKMKKKTEEKVMEAQDVVQKCNIAVKTVATNAASLLNCLRKGISTHESEMKTQLLVVSDDAEKFRRNEVKTYESTGMTPARKEYRIVRDLAATSPHNRIIRKFVLDNTASDLDSSIVSEADESMNDSSIILMESTPMKLDDNVTERKQLKELHLSEILTLDAITEENKENTTIIN